MDSQLIISQKKQKNSYGSKIELRSPAKINLYLNIVGQYPQGYHRLESLVERISLFDKLSLEITSGPAVKIKSNIKQLETKNNLVYRAVELMKKEFNISAGFNICLEKNIPVGSGLGGGSSNAALSILGINELFSLDISLKKLYALGEKIGSDVNFFLSGSSYACLFGRGEKVEPLARMGKLKHFIIWPKIFLSTKQVYKKLKSNLTGGRQELTRFFSSVNMLKYSLRNLDYFLLEKSIYNCLEKSAFLLSARLARVKKRLGEKNISVFMSGSGSSFYTIGLENYQELRKALPDNWAIYKVQTF